MMKSLSQPRMRHGSDTDTTTAVSPYRALATRDRQISKGTAEAPRRRATEGPERASRQQCRVVRILCLLSLRLGASAVLFLIAHHGVIAQQPATAEQTQFFEARVRPLLAEHCWSCHGPKRQSGGIRLDSRKEILGASEHGPIIVPGHPEKSVLGQVIQHTGPIKMPPKSKLPQQAIDTLTAWIKLGAPWPEKQTAQAATNGDAKKHWAFQPVRRPSLPAVQDPAWPQTPIDTFILAELERNNLRPAPPAAPEILLRRLHFDLVGLPPTPEDVESFAKVCADHRGRVPSAEYSVLGTQHSALPPAAIEHVVDRLLASPHYGARWGRYWLDVARFADTKGYVFFEDADFTWAWTYRDYVVEAFNRDLPMDRFIVEQLAADQLDVGADKRRLRALGFLTLGGRFMNNVHDVIDDRIDVVTRGLMGLTATCARCHDHKYDPISAKDYYGLYGVFASCVEPTVPPLYEPPPATDGYKKFEKELADRERKLMDFVRAKHEELTAGARKRVAEYLVAAHALRDQPSTEDFMLIADGNDLNPTMTVRWQKYLDNRARRPDRVFGPWHALARIPDKDFGAAAPAVLNQALTEPVNPLVVKSLAAMTPTSMAEVAGRYAQVLHAVEVKWRDAVKLGQADMKEPAEEELRLVLFGPDAPANVALLPYGDLSLLPDRPSQAKLQEYRKALEKWRTSGPGAPPRALTLADLPMPATAHVFLRGNPNNKGEHAPRRLPELFASSKPFEHGSGRLELAQAIASRDNPLTARVLVNRVWLHHFGAGLVRTPSDFGLRSEPPSHPELLDYLASWFMDNGWSLKKLHRLIVLSAVYQQASVVSSQWSVVSSKGKQPDAATVDPDNRLLWRMNRRRLDFEATRDALLAVSGKLNHTVGGPSIRDPLAGSANRRTLYNFLDRLNVPGLFRTFDFPSPDATSPQRDTTTVAPQALFLMNHPFVMDCARALAERPDVVAIKRNSDKIDRLHRLLFGRPATPEERRLGETFVTASGNTLGAWQRYAHALLLLNELVIVD